jgi:microcin C transport system substrate-binding protein
LLDSGAQPPYPRFWDDYHSDNAFKIGKDGKREIVTDTNNMTQTADPALDPIIDQHRKAKTEEEVQRLSWQLAKAHRRPRLHHPCLGIASLPLHDLALGAWPSGAMHARAVSRSMPTCSGSMKMVKRETQEAIRTGRDFGETDADLRNLPPNNEQPASSRSKTSSPRFDTDAGA